MRRKMVLVGAGSAVFTKGLVLDILERPDEEWDLALVDTDPEALAVMEKLCAKMVAQRGPHVTLSASVDRRDVLAGADYVVSTIGVGGRRAWEQDVFIPRKYGIWQPVGDTVGPGGISRAMRMIPQLVDIAQDVKKLCPKAVFINYSNPMTMNCMAVRRATGVPLVGLCHGVKNGVRRLAGFLGIPAGDIRFTACGLNHMVFLYHLRDKEGDLFPRFIEKLEKTPAEGRAIGPLTAAFVRENHTYVVSDDRHFSEFVPAVTAQGAYYGRTLGREAFSFEGTIQIGDEAYEEHRRWAHSAEPLPDSFFRREEGEHEQLMEMIEALDTDKAGVFYANLPNNGAVRGVPDDTVVERPALLTGSGIQPVQLPDFPAALLPPMLRYAAIYEVAVEAALTGSTYLFRHAMEEATLPLPKEQSSALAEELLAAHRRYLPQFE